MLYMQLGANEFHRKRRHSGTGIPQMDFFQMLRVDRHPVFITR
jgi:hypothetical protein